MAGRPGTYTSSWRAADSSRQGSEGQKEAVKDALVLATPGPATAVVQASRPSPALTFPALSRCVRAGQANLGLSGGLRAPVSWERGQPEGTGQV